VFDVVIERVAIADAFKRDARHRRDELGQMRMRRAEVAIQLIGEKGAQSFRR
jgi:hypothetical protein